MKKNIKNLLFVVLLALFAVLTLTGCNGVLDSSADESETVSVSFGVDSSSRALYVDVVSDYEIGNLYWAYTATHKSGLHYIGESEVLGVSGDTGTDGVKAGGYKLKPVRRGAVKGLGIADDKFSRGNWTFKLYGYTGYNESTGVFSGLVYTGTTVESEVSLYTPSLYTPQFTDGFVAVNFLLTEFDGTDTGRTATAGKLVVAPLTFTIPEDMVLHSGKTLCAELADNSGSGSPVRKLYCELPMTQTLRAGEKIVLPFANVTGYDGTWDTGSTNGEKLLSLKWKLWVGEHPETGDPIVGDTLAEGVIVDIPVRAGASTFLYGDIDDVARQSTNPVPTSLMEPVCYTGTPGTNTYKEWTSLAEAINTISTKTGTAEPSDNVYLLRDVSNGGVVTKCAKIVTNGYGVSNLVWGSQSLICIGRVSGTGSATDNAIKLYFMDGATASFSVGKDEYKTVFLDVHTSDVTGDNKNGVTVAHCRNVYITGVCGSLNAYVTYSDATQGDLVNGVGIHFLGRCISDFKINCANRYMELGPDAVIGAFKVTHSDGFKSVVVGYPTTTVSNYTTPETSPYYNPASTATVAGTTNSLLVPVTFDANDESVYSDCVDTDYNGSCSGTKTVYWIKGIPIPVTSTFLSNFKMKYCGNATQKTALGFKTFGDSEDGVPVSGNNYFTGAVSIPCNGPMRLYAYYSNYHLYAQKVYCLYAGGAKFDTGRTITSSSSFTMYCTFRMAGSADIVSTGNAICLVGSASDSDDGKSMFIGILNKAYTMNVYYGSDGSVSKTLVRGDVFFRFGATPRKNGLIPTARYAGTWGIGTKFFLNSSKIAFKNSSGEYSTNMAGGTWSGVKLWLCGEGGTTMFDWYGDIGETNMYEGSILRRCYKPCVLRRDIPAGSSASRTADAKGTAGMWDVADDKFYKSNTTTAFRYRKFKDGAILTGVAY